MAEPPSTARGDWSAVFGVGVAVAVATASMIWATTTSTTTLGVVGPGPALTTNVSPDTESTSVSSSRGTTSGRDQMTSPSLAARVPDNNAAMSGRSPVQDRSTAASTTPVDEGSGAAQGHSPGWIPAGPDAKTVTDDSFEFGISYIDVSSMGPAASALSGDESTANAFEGDYKKANQVVVDYINENGGIGGRQVVADYHERYVYEQEPDQTACAHWTEDHPVFAFTSNMFWSDEFLECAYNANTPYLLQWSAPFLSTQSYPKYADIWYTVFGFLTDVRERIVTTGLHEYGWFEPVDAATPMKLGVIYPDRPRVREGIELGMKPALAALGMPITTEIAYPRDFTEAPWQTYVLRLMADGVTHVLWGTNAGGAVPVSLFMRSAENQNYRPLHGIGTDQQPQYLGLFGSPDEQQDNTTVFHWNFTDGATDDPPTHPGYVECHDLVEERRGHTDEMHLSIGTCAALFFLRDAFARADEFSVTGLRQGVERLGRAHNSPFGVTGETLYRPGEHYGQTQNVFQEYDRGCSCFVTVTGPRTFR